MNVYSTAKAINKGSFPPGAFSLIAVRRQALRLLWLIVIFFALSLFLSGIPQRYDRLIELAHSNANVLEEMALSVYAYAAYFTALDLILVLTHVILAALIFWQRSDNLMAIFVSLTLITMPLAAIGALESSAPVWGSIANFIITIGLTASIILLFLFPDGRFVPAWTLPLTIIWALMSFSTVFFPTAPLSFPTWPRYAQLLTLLVWCGTAVYAQIHRTVHVSSPFERQQTKWALLGLTAAILGPISHYLNLLTLPSLSQVSSPDLFYNLADPAVFKFALLIQVSGLTLYTLALLVFPLSFAVAILRHQLFDIHFIINRTLVYSLLSLTLALLYIGSVIALQTIFNSLTSRALSGQVLQITIVISTLVIATLFRPLRRSIQEVIDRRFYRHKYNAAKTLEAFGETLRDEVELDSLTRELLAVVQETMQPTQVSLWLRDNNVGRKAASDKSSPLVPIVKKKQNHALMNDAEVNDESETK